MIVYAVIAVLRENIDVGNIKKISWSNYVKKCEWYACNFSPSNNETITHKLHTIKVIHILVKIKCSGRSDLQGIVDK